MTSKNYWITCPYENKNKGKNKKFNQYLPLLLKNIFTFLFDFLKGLLD